MVGGVTRNYFSGLSSGMDTDALIEATIKAESASKYSLERKRTTLGYKQTMLQEVNLKLYNLQTKASDLLLSKSFTTKKVTASDDKLVSAVATTAAKVGSYKLKVKQLATATSVSSGGKLAGSLMNGQYLGSKDKLGGAGTKLSELGIAGDDKTGLHIDYTSPKGDISSLDITGISADDTIEEAIKKINSQIDGDKNLKGKITASYDGKNNQIRFTSTDGFTTSETKITDTASGEGIIGKLFEKSDAVKLNGTAGAAASTIKIDSGLNTTLKALGLQGSEFKVKKGSTEVEIKFADLGLTEDSTMKEALDAVNEKLSTDGIPASFGYNEITGKLELRNDKASDKEEITLTDSAGTFTTRLFGSNSVTSVYDDSKKLSEESFSTIPSAGKITVDGVQIDINPETDTLSDVLSRITSLTGVNAEYDSKTDSISFTRKDGSSAPIGVGSPTDSSNFLKITGMISGSQNGAVLKGSRGISGIDSSAPLSLAGFAVPVKAGTFTLNGQKFEIKGTATTLDDVLKMINENEKVGVTAQYDPTGGGFVLTSRETGNQSIAIGAAGDTSNFFEAMGLTGAEQKVGQNAIYSIDGMFGGADQVSQSNSVSDAVDGVTFELKGVTDGAGETIDVKTDSETAMETIKGFIETYNEVTEMVYGYLTEDRQKDSSENYLEALSDEEMDQLDAETLESYEAAYKKGLLRNDTTLRSVRTQLRSAITSIVKGVDAKFNSLSDIGISTGRVGSSYTETMVGKIEITDEDALKKALEENPDDVAKLFNAEGGIGRKLKDILNSFTASDGMLTRRVGRSDSSVNNEFTSQIDAINKQIADHSRRLAAREESLIKQFAQLESAMSEFQAQSGAFAGIMGGAGGAPAK